MRKIIVAHISIVFVILLFSVPASGAAYGPEEWHQYRSSSDKNAVFDNESDSLNFKKFKTANEVRSTPVVVGNSLFIGNHESGDLFAFDIHTGEELWHNEAPNWIHSEMIYHEEKVYVGVGNRFIQKETGFRGTGENGVFAYDAKTGEELWKYNTDGEVMATPVYYEGFIYAVTGDMHTYKLDAETGKEVHKEEIGSWVSMSAPALYNAKLFFGGGGNLPYQFSAYDLETDEFKWQEEFSDVISGLDDVPPAIDDDIVVTTALEQNETTKKPEHFLYALDTDTGELLWKESLGVGKKVKNNKSGAPMIYRDTIYVGSPVTKTFYAYDLESGEKLWEFEDAMIKAPPVAKDNVVYLSNLDGVVRALATEDGEVLGKFEVGSAIAPAGPIIVNETMFIGSQDSFVYATPLSDFTSNIETDENLTIQSDDDRNSYVIYFVLALLVLVMMILLRITLKRRRK